MTAVATNPEVEAIRLIDVKEAAQHDPKALIAEINAFDPTTLEPFRFSMFPEERDELWPYPTPRADPGWLFQAAVVDWWMGVENPLHETLKEWSPNFTFDAARRVFLILKARQLGITWLAMAVGIWYLLFRPGARVVAYSYTEEEAKKLVGRAWLMFNSLPAALRDHVEVITPSRTDEPSEWIKVRHTMPDGTTLISSIQALPATKKAGHGDTVTWAVMDEVARQDYARQIYTAILPAVARGDARLALISTSNGIGNVETGVGNYFHILYATRKEKGLGFAFLPWNAEPTRDEEWYRLYAMSLDEVERNQQYPLNENDAFMLSGALYFDRESLKWYRENPLRPMRVGQFTQIGNRKGNFISVADGIIELFELPRAAGKYGIAVDASTGRADDFTSAGVIDLETGNIAAELHAKIEAPRAAIQLHFLGKLYRGREEAAKIAVERQGGYGEALITFLRDGHGLLPPYPNLYRHTDYTAGKKPISENYGMPMGPKNRQQIVEGLKEWIRLRQSAGVSTGIADELGTFVYADTTPSPRAMEGANDDRVMMFGILVDLFRQYGSHAAPKKRWSKNTYSPPPTRPGV
jgi:hypothetical protein